MGSDIYELQGNTALYDVLGVPKTSTDKEIRRAYYRLAVVYHPDKNPDGEEIFKEVTFAYNILSDPEQRRMYDNKTLKKNLQGRAKEYDPEMDPHVELSQEDLRKFVDKLRAQQQSKKAALSDFEARREEEMKRRAEYDAKNPEFKKEYERQRALRRSGAANQQALAQQNRDDGKQNQVALPSALHFRTSAEMVANLQEEERRRARGERVASPTRRSAKLGNIKETMMYQYRQGETAKPSHALTTTQPREVPECVRGHQPISVYSATVDETIEQYKNYDYLDVVVNDKDDKIAMDNAILADALSLYDKKN